MKIILDLDTGIDDALALAYALAAEADGHELLGITGTYGNVTVEQGVRNTRALLALLGRPDVPVYAGPQKPGFKVLEISAFIHGRNGVGEVDLPGATSAAPTSGAAVEDAVDFLIESFREHGSDLVIVPTGPSTTIAAALRREPALADAAIVFMGGALTVPGNVTPLAEANVSQDPAATDYLVRHGRNVAMVGLDVTLRTLLTPAETAQWRALATPAGDAYADMVDYYITAYETTSPHLGGCGLHDPLAVAAALDPSLITWLPLNLKCEETGRTIGDPERLSEKPTTRVAVGVDAAGFLADFMERLTALFAETGR